MEMEAKNHSSRTDLISELPELIETAAQMTILCGNHTETNTKQRNVNLQDYFFKDIKFPFLKKIRLRYANLDECVLKNLTLGCPLMEKLE